MNPMKPIKTKKSMAFILMLGLNLFGFTSLALAEGWSLFDKKPFAEMDVVLPTKLPDPKNIKGLLVSLGSPLFFGIDTTSVIVGDDDVIRYVMAIHNPSGTQQIKYEGIRCDTFEYKVFAHVNAEGKWVLNNTDWKPIPRGGYNQYQSTLGWNGFCVGTGPNRNKTDMFKELPFTDTPWTTTPLF
jgi:hypothetical protein